MIEIREVPRISARADDAHKGDFGRTLVVAGSRGMAGAAVLAGRAALRSGAGLVRVAVPGDILPTVACGEPCYTTVGLPQDLRGRFAAGSVDELVEIASDADVVVVGPGIGRSEAIPRVIRGLLEHTELPVVIDADALNALQDATVDWWRSRTASMVVTPHPGEFQRLSGVSVPDQNKDRVACAGAFAMERRLVVVLKGAGTVVTDGERYYVNETGNPGMASGGSGDVLAGMIPALIGQGMAPFDAAVLAVHVHGRAGDMAAQRIGQVSLIATDILDDLPRAFREVVS